MPTIDFQDSGIIAQIKIIDGDYRKTYERLQGKLCTIDVKEWHAKRSLNANALFHLMVDRIAKAHNPPISKIRCKRILMARYGVDLYLDDECTILQAIKTNIPPEKMLEEAEDHWRVARNIDDDLWMYVRMKHTRDYNTAEFAKLLDGTIEDAKEMGIDTVTESEKQKALELWGLKIDR